MQIQLTKGNEEFTLDPERGEWLNAKGQKLPKDIRKIIANKPIVRIKLKAAFDRLRSAGVEVTRHAPAIGLIAASMYWSNNVSADLAEYRAAVELGAPMQIDAARRTMLLNSPMLDGGKVLLGESLLQVDGGSTH